MDELFLHPSADYIGFFGDWIRTNIWVRSLLDHLLWVAGALAVSANSAHLLRVWERGGLGTRSSGSLRCSGEGVSSYLAGRGSVGPSPGLYPLTL
jgi:hypothetical protein